MKLKTIALATALAFAATVAQAEIIIDKFNDPWAAPGQTVTTDGSPAFVTNTATGLLDVLGGSRTLSIECVDGCVDGSTTRSASLSVEVGELAWVNGTNVRSDAIVSWDANGTGLNFDMQAAGNSIVATILEADLGFNYILSLETDGVGRTELFSGTLFAVPDTAPQDAFYDLSWFELADGSYVLGGLPFTITNFGGGVDLTDVDRIFLQLSNVGTCYQSGTVCSTAVDLRIDDARVVPEPGSMALAGLGLLGLAALRRRKQQA